MKGLISKSLLLCSFLALAACDIEGTLQAHQNFNMVDKKGKVVAFQAGRGYPAEISKDDNMLKIEVKVDGKDRTIKVAAPAGQQIPQNEGEVFVSASQSGQPVDMHGILDTEYDRGPEQYGSVRCSEWRQVRVCGNVYVKDNHGGHYEYRCWWENRQVPGQQDVRYYDLRTTTTANIAFLQPGTSTHAGDFYGQRVTTEQVITWQSMCRVYPY